MEVTANCNEIQDTLLAIGHPLRMLCVYLRWNQPGDGFASSLLAMLQPGWTFIFGTDQAVVSFYVLTTENYKLL